MLYTRQDVLTKFEASILEEAERLLEQGSVELPDVRGDGKLITSFVRQAARQPFRVYIRVDSRGRRSVKVRGECSCAARGDCAHVAAVLLRALAEDRETPPRKNAAASARATRTSGRQKGQPLRLLYLLFPITDHGACIEVETVTAVSSPNGGFERLRRYHPGLAAQRTPPSFLLDNDLELLAQLGVPTSEGAGGRWRLHGRAAETLLDGLLASKRCLLGHTETELHNGQARPAELKWTVDKHGNQYPEFASIPPAPQVFKLASLWYVDASSGDCGRLESALPQTLIEELTELREGVPANDTPHFHNDLVERYPGIEMPPLRQLDVQERMATDPVPCLRLSTLSAETWMGEIDVALLTFDYDGARIDDPKQSHVLAGDTLLKIKRNRSFEGDCAERLLEAGLSRTVYRHGAAAVDSFVFTGESEGCLEFQAQMLPELRKHGWQVEVDEGFRHRLAEIERWFGDIEPLRDGDWFGLRLGVQVDGEHINLLPALVDLLERLPREFHEGRLRELYQRRPLFVNLSNGRTVALPFDRVRNILETLFELYDANALDADSRLRLNRIQLGRLAELDDYDPLTPVQWLGDEGRQAITERFRNIEKIPEVEPPTGFQSELRDYQRHGLAWLQFLRQNELGGILADDMGLGKTVQTLAHLLLEKQWRHADLPSLVVAPTSLLTNWRREVTRFSPDLRVLTLHGPQRGGLFDRIPDHDLVLTTYPLLARDQDGLLRHDYHLLILDEAQSIKNPKTQASRLVRQLRARHRLCLTGTPLENHLGELWSLFDFLLPGLLGTDKQFRRRIRYPIEKLEDRDAAMRLSRRLRPFMLRRTKEQVIKELPAKTEILRSIELQGSQRELYEDIRLAMHERVRRAVAEKGWAGSQILVLDALLKLRQVCCDPRLVKLESARVVQESAKLELLMELLPGLIEEGRKVLLFSQFTSMLALIEQAIDEAALPYVKLTGLTQDRAAPVDVFQRGEVPLFLISLRAGGLGLNLTAADTVIHYDPWWNPAVERQATDRAHRIGQEKPVFVYKLISEGTVEEKIHELQARKQLLADSLFEQQGGTRGGWTAADLEALFEPLG